MSLQQPVIEKPETVLFKIADYVTERNHMCYFYLGSDKPTRERLANIFDSGYSCSDLNEAGEFLQQLYFNSQRLPDAVFFDIPYSEKELFHFCSRLKNNLLLSSLPLIYNETQLSDAQVIHLNRSRLVDDIVTINSPGINFLTKILFIKQSKLYNQLSSIHKHRKESHRREFDLLVSKILKRTIDISIAGFGILLLSPVFLVIAMAIRLESRGPVFYTALRAGKGFRVFKFYKFRSMVINADKEVDKMSALNQYQGSENGAVFFKVNNDPRITRLGKLLRNSSIDELPQLFNVLKGDMSVVGNRPLPIYEAVNLTTNEFVERFSAPAGITGLWQVNKRGKSEMSAEERIMLDITYSRKCSVLDDLKILAKTPIALFQKNDV